MNIIIYTLVILTIFYLLLKKLVIFHQKNIQGFKNSNYNRINFFSYFVCFRGSIFINTPITLASLALLKLKGLSIFQLISLFRLIQTLRRSGRFSFNQSNLNNQSTISVSEAYKILNLDINKKITKDEVNKAYIKIQKKIHPDVSPETSRLSSYCK